MPIQYFPFPEYGYVIAKCVGPLSDKELLSERHKFLESDLYQPGMHELADLTEANFDLVSSNGLKRFADMAATFFQNRSTPTKTAILAPKDLAFGLGRMYATFSDNSLEQVRVFREKSDAISWLLGEEVPELE